MTAYQNYWDTMITELLNELNASDQLRLNIVDTLKDSERTQIFPNHVINALKIGLSLKAGAVNTALVAPMQSGKSGTIYFLCNYVLPEIGFLAEDESVLFVTSMRDTDLYEQNRINLEKEYFDKGEGYRSSVIQVVKMNEFFASPNPFKLVEDFKVKLVVRDEDQYGCGEESSFDKAFFTELRSRIENLCLLSVSATPYDILEAKLNGYPVEVIEGERPEKYYGISEMLEQNLIESYPEGFNPLVERIEEDDTIYSLHPIMNRYAQHLLKFEDGLGIVRVSKSSKALNLRTVIKNRYGKELKCVCIGSDSECDYSIKEGLDIISKLVLRQKKRVVLIVVQALSAGKDLGNLKNKVRFGIESRGSQLANGSQGIAGRLCGYHDNRDFKLMANVELLQHYAQFEQNWEIYSEDEWKDRLYDLGVRNLSTHTFQRIVQKEGVIRPIRSVETFSVEQLVAGQKRDQLTFLSDEAYEKLLDFFTPEIYEGSKSMRFGENGVTIRLSSNYRLGDNRVEKNWENSVVGADFGSIMFKKENYEYGILISNFPIDDSRNNLGFCGIKVLESSSPIRVERLTNTDGDGMYKTGNEGEQLSA